MTISSTTRVAGPFTGNGTASAFPFAFKVFAAGDLDVLRTLTSTGVVTTLVLNSDYTVALNADQNTSPGGTVTLTGGNLATGTTLLIASGVDNTQQVDLTNQGGFYPEVINDALDRATIQVQQVQGQANRGIRYPDTEISLNAVLPKASDRANQYLAFDSTGAVDIGGAVPAQRYYGSKTSDPATRNDGTARQSGDLYFNSVANVMKVYNGSAWDTVTTTPVDGDKGDITISGGGATYTIDNGAVTSAKLNASLAITTSLTVGGQTVGPKGPATNTVLGTNAGAAISSGVGNTLIGSSAGQGISASDFNTLVGEGASVTSSGTDGVAVGRAARASVTGISIGNYAGNSQTASAGSNIAIGHATLLAVTSGSSNIAVGPYSGTTLTTGANNCIIGAAAETQGAANSNSIVIGAGAVGAGSNTTVIGNASTTRTIIPAGTLEVAGQATFGSVGQSLINKVASAPTGANVNVTTIPSWAQRITISLGSISTNGTSAIVVRVGNGSFATTGYDCRIDQIGTANALVTTYFPLARVSVAAGRHSGIMTLDRMTADGSVWAMSSQIIRIDTMSLHVATGLWIQGSNLMIDRVQVATENGTDLFDGGHIAISWA